MRLDADTFRSLSALVLVLAAAVITLFTVRAYAALTIYIPQNITIGDGEKANITLLVNITEASRAQSITAGLALRLDPQIFNISGASAEAFYVDDAGNVHTLSPQVTYSEKGIDIEVDVGSTISKYILLNITAIVPTLPGVVQVLGVPVKYMATVYAYGYNITYGNVTVRILPKPPTITIGISPGELVSPGVPVNVGIGVYDASGVYNVTARILRGNTSIVERVWDSSVTSNNTWFTRYLNVSGLGKGDYTVYVEACDIIGNCADKTVAFTVTDVFNIPRDFPSLSAALVSPAVADNVTITVEGVVNESETVVVAKRVRIVGENATVAFNNTLYGFNITVPGVVLANLTVEGARTALLLCSNNVVVKGVNARASKFLELCSTAYTANTVVDSSLNGTPVLYLHGAARDVRGGAYAEAHLYNGVYSLTNTSIGYVETFNSSVAISYSRINRVRDLGGSRVEFYASPVPEEYVGTTTSLFRAYMPLRVTVRYAGEPLAGALVEVSGAALAEPLKSTTRRDGVASFNVTIAFGTQRIEAYNAAATVKAYYRGLVSVANVALTQPTSVTLDLPVPELEAVLTDLQGRTITEIKPGQLLRINISVDLKGFKDEATVIISLVRDGDELYTIELPVTGMGSGNLTVYIMVPWVDGDYSVRAKLKLQGLPEQTIELPP